jgi:hypothetical protein
MRSTSRIRLAKALAILAIALGLAAAWASSSKFFAARNRVEVLNGLRDEINANYGFDENRFPRVNCGPCARFAILFRDQWNARFAEQLNITCVMTPDRAACGHVVLKFPDGSYFDGGNGVFSEQQLRAMFPNNPIEEMVHFDLPLLDKLVGGLNQKHYPICPNYSDRLTGKLIEKHLSRLPTSAN